jgi:Ca-activated chloride channel family protein
VYDLEIRIGQRIIRSAIREREEAKRIYEAAKAEGKRAALVEQERPNIFTASVANLMPGDKVDVRLRFVQPLQWEDGRIRLTFPTVVGPRYIPGTQPVGYSGTGWSLDTDAVTDASRITPPVRHPDSRPGHDLSLAVELDAGFHTASVKCVSHGVNVRKLDDGRQRVELAAGATLPNRDFVLELYQAPGAVPQTALFLSPEPGAGETHFLLAAFPPTAPRSERVPIEMLYLVDVSGSMAGTSIEQAREALLQALDRLSPGDRFGIVAFESNFTAFAPEPLLATTGNLDAARRWVRSLEANGGTEMLPALRHLMAFPGLVGHLRHILVLTDGDLGNEEQIFDALRRNLGDARLFTVAIGSAPNHFLATKMAQFGRGSFTHIADAAEIQQQIGRLLDRIASPVLTNVTLAIEGVQAAEIYPEKLPDLFLRQPLVIYGRIANGKAGRVRFAARAGSSAFEANIPFDAAKATFHPGITTLWARQRIEDALDRWRTAEEKDRDGIRAAIVADAIRYRLVTRFTSLVAVEEVVANPGGQQHTAAVPTELPHGWQLDKVFGAPATGTADEFLEALGVVLLLSSITLLWLLRRTGATA